MKDENQVRPRSGDVLLIGKAASVQFQKPLLFRVIRVHDWPTYQGWVWLDGYELNPAGDAVERRSIFVQTSGIRSAVQAPDPRQRNARPVARQPARASGDPVARRVASATPAAAAGPQRRRN